MTQDPPPDASDERLARPVVHVDYRRGNVSKKAPRSGPFPDTSWHIDTTHVALMIIVVVGSLIVLGAWVVLSWDLGF